MVYYCIYYLLNEKVDMCTFSLFIFFFLIVLIVFVDNFRIT